MNNICVKVEKLSKRFFVRKSRNTALQTVKALIRRRPLKQQLWVLRDISFEVRRGEKLAIVGKNASGKTTLLRILTGIYDQTSGYVKLESTPTTLFQFSVGFNPNLSVIDNVYFFGAVHGIERRVLQPKLDEVLETSELYPRRFSLLGELSTGQKQRFALSVFFQNTSDFLIFDESLTYYMDRYFLEKCKRAYFHNLFSSEKTVIITSQDTSFLKTYCQTAIWLDKGSIRMKGEAGEVIGEYERT